MKVAIKKHPIIDQVYDERELMMKYLVVYNADNINSAYAFDSYADARIYIETCSLNMDNHLNKLKAKDDNHYEMKLRNGEVSNIEIIELPESKIGYDISLFENGKHKGTYRSPSREKAETFVKRILEYLKYRPEPKEDNYGVWEIKSQKKGLNIKITLNLVLLEGNKQLDYSAANHGNDADDINESKVIKSYSNIDMRHFFSDLNDTKIEHKPQLGSPKKEPKTKTSTEKGILEFFKGILEILIGILLTFISFGVSSSAGIVFTGWILVGLYDIFKGLFLQIVHKIKSCK